MTLTRSFFVKHPKLAILLKFVPVFVMFWIVSWQKLDPDFGWHLQAGRYITSHGIPGHDIYSYTASSFKWIDHEWGYDVILANIFKLSHGWEILATLFATLWTLMMYVSGRKSSALLLVIATFAVLPYAGIRPMVFTFLLFVALLKLSNHKSWRLKFLIPLMFVLWANLHGGLIIGLLILIYFSYRDKDAKWLLVLLASILATFINPYGPALYLEIGRTILDSSVHSRIAEWAYLTFYWPSYLFTILWGFGFLLFDLSAVGRLLKEFIKHPFRWHKIDNLLLGPLTLLLAANATRNVPIFVVTNLSQVDDYLRQALAMFPKKLNRIAKGMIAIMIFGSLYLGVKSYQNSFTAFNVVRGAGYPSQAVDYINEHGCGGGNIFNFYDYGGYLVWKLPAYKIYIDGRMPVWRDENGRRYMDDYLRLIHDKEFMKSQFDKYNVSCMLVPIKSKFLVNYGNHNKWIKAAEADGWVLLVRP